MQKFYTVDWAMGIFKILNDNPYSPIWTVIEDFSINGHIISVKNSHQLRQVIVDGKYEYIGGSIIINRNGVDYAPLEYLKKLLLDQFD